MSQPPYPQQPEPGSQQPGYQQPAYRQPGSPYPDYQNAPAPPSGYGVGGMPPPPPGSGAAPPQQAVTRPNTVTYAFYALIANMVLGLIAAILIFANRDAYVDQALRDAGLDPSAAGTSDIVNAGFTIGAIIGIVFVALWALFLWFAWTGHNWARIVIWVLGGLSLFGVFNAFSSPLGIVVVLNVVTLLLTVAAIVLLALKPSNEWYAYQGNARRYGWPGRA